MRHLTIHSVVLGGSPVGHHRHNASGAMRLEDCVLASSSVCAFILLPTNNGICSRGIIPPVCVCVVCTSCAFALLALVLCPIRQSEILNLQSRWDGIGAASHSATLGSEYPHDAPHDICTRRQLTCRRHRLARMHLAKRTLTLTQRVLHTARTALPVGDQFSEE